MTHLACMDANFVARQADYWGARVDATRAFFKPEDTFELHFDELLTEVKAMGFTGFDLWTEFLNPSWASDEQIHMAKDLLEHLRLSVPSLAGWFGETRADFKSNCKLAKTLGTPVLGGGTGLLQGNPTLFEALLKDYDLQLGYENHPEKTPTELIGKIHGGSEHIGVTLDTGWFGTHAYNAAKAIKELEPHLVYIHFKDVKAAGNHETCRPGAGVVPLKKCCRASPNRA